ncbi:MULTISPECIES: hypothetical protein [Achromobacter]|uniref:Uncharacterized protein n=1 Tax=Achromobacter spanius TaxID=217203 RepID=A0ABY8GSP3_9BURK|nr:MULTISPECIES: hypothetical protein [Achromobacter]WAI83208.1 hypothetical protein N8Z00_27565 [Achromobacter spanius]WEX93293.1 hypothetical protein N3Z32_22160 [Achromobacter sp. SS2-2022]WFP07549.1 hypothetical protein P8T11_25090 [Achromobacter spanius]
MANSWIFLADYNDAIITVETRPIGEAIYRLTKASSEKLFKSTGLELSHVLIATEPVGLVAHVYDLAGNARGIRLGEISFQKTPPILIQYTGPDASSRTERWTRDLPTLLEAKRALASLHRLPLVDAHPGDGEDIDSRLKHGGIDPNSVQIIVVNE